MADDAKRPLTLEDCAGLDRASTDAAAPEDFFAALDAVAGETVGHRLFTISAFDPPHMRLRRVHSSRPDVYPVGGGKSKAPSPWTETVLLKGEVFLGRDASDIRAAFDDHATISGLGLGSIINVPVRLGPRVLGTMNLTHRPGWYVSGDIPPARLLGGFLAPWLRDLQS